MKYETEMATLENCPPATCVVTTSSAVFRFFHDPDSEKNYLPPAKINPRRKWESDTEACDALGLSMFFSAEKAEAYFRSLETINRNIGKNIGKHIATGTIEINEGRWTPEEASGHFSLFEADACVLQGRFQICKTLAQ